VPDSLKSHPPAQLLERAQYFYDINPLSALMYGQAARHVADSLHSQADLIMAQLMVARTLRRLGYFTSALEQSLLALSQVTHTTDTALLISAHLTVGNIYMSLHNYSEAGEHLLRALQLAERSHSPSLANCLGFLGLNCVRTGLYDSALTLLYQARETELKNPQPGFALLYIYNYLGEAYLALQRWDEARHHFLLAQALAEERKNPFGQTFTWLGLAELNLKQQQHSQARAYALKALEVARKHHFTDRERLAYELLYKSYEAEHDYANAYRYHRKYDALHDSLFNLDNLNYISRLRLQYETEKIRQENELLQKTMELEQSRYEKRVSILSSIALALGALVLTLALWHTLHRQRSRIIELTKSFRQGVESTVKARTRRLDIENQQLQQFNYIIAHNLKAPIARMRGLAALVALQHGKSEELEKLELSIQELEQTISDLMDIIRLKSLPPESHRPIVFSELLQKVTSQLQDKIQESKATITYDLQINQCVSVPAYLESIMFNLISNALKYRSDKRPLEISITSAKENNHCVVRVRDNGSGFDATAVKEKLFQPYQRFHQGVEGKGLGLFMVKTQVEALGGYLEVDSRPDEGATFTLHLPITHLSA
jgi:signal transduction histidine kinase